MSQFVHGETRKRARESKGEAVIHPIRKRDGEYRVKEAGVLGDVKASLL